VFEFVVVTVVLVVIVVVIVGIVAVLIVVIIDVRVSMVVVTTEVGVRKIGSDRTPFPLTTVHPDTSGQEQLPVY